MRTKIKKQTKPRFIRDLPDDVYFDFLAYARKRSITIGKALVPLMQRALAEAEAEELEARAESIRGR